MNHVQLTVIIPFYNSEKTLPFCLKGLAFQTFSAFEVILVNNNSTDSSEKIVQDFIKNRTDKFYCLIETKQGASSARNTGAGRAKGDIIAFMDADCIPESDWLENIASAFNQSQIGAVAGKIAGYTTESLFDKFHALFTLKCPHEAQTYSEFTVIKGGFPTANLSVKKHIFEQIGGFDETLKLYGEDYDLCARIYKAGYFIRYIPNAVIYHIHRSTLKGTWKQSFGFGTGHGVLLKKHFQNLVIIDFPKFQWISKKWKCSAWLDLAGADKKLCILVLLSYLWLPFILLTLLYLLFLYKNINSRLRSDNIRANFHEKWLLVFLLLFKSTALTIGRVAGSIKNRVFCF